MSQGHPTLAVQRAPLVVGSAWVVGGLVAMFAAGVAARAQLEAQSPATADSQPAFEVASVKPNKSGDPFVIIRPPLGDQFTATNVPLRNLIRMAYGIQEFQLLGGPDWIRSDRFDIVAKADSIIPAFTPSGPPDVLLAMIRTLLADRFKLAVHHETRELPIYALILARGDGQLGAQLRPSAVDCVVVMSGARGRGGPPPSPPPPGERPFCGARIGPGQLIAGGVPLAQVATFLSPFVQRAVLDRTGLSGAYDLNLSWTPDQMPQGPPPLGAPPLPPVDPNGPSIFTALQEQLGLKLDPQRGPVDVVVIDRVDRPTED